MYKGSLGMIGDIAGAVIWTDNFDEMVSFYSYLFKDKTQNKHKDFVSFRLGNTKLGIGKHSKINGKSSDPFRLMLHLEVDDIEHEYIRLSQYGIKFLRVPEKEHWGGFIATFKDIDQNILQLIQKL